MVQTTRLPREDAVRIRSLIIWVVILAAVASVAGIAQTSVGHYVLRGVGLYKAPASYTSLAFTDPQSLPTRLSSAPTRLQMSFALSNTSADPRTYHWSIVLQGMDHARRLAAGEIQIPAGNRVTVTRTIKASCTSGQARMTVQIVAPAESIDFWMTCSSRKGVKR